MCARLGKALIPFTGADGYAALLRRALALARAEAPLLRNVTLDSSHRLEGLEGLARDEGGEAAAALAAHLLALLVTFIGEPLTLRLVRQGWPDTPLPSTLDTQHPEE